FKDSLTGGGARDALAAASGDSLSIRWFEAGTRVTLLDVWTGNNASKMDVFIRSPLLHDNTSGIRLAHQFNPTLSGADGNPQLLFGPQYVQPLHPTDTLIVEVLGTALDDVTACLSLMYETPSMPGGRFLTADEAINSDDDRLKANTDYALIGLTTDLPFTALKIVGPDTANLGVPIPGHWN